MVTIIGSGIGDNGILDLYLSFEFDCIICDKSVDIDKKNIYKGNFKEVKEFILDNRDKNLLYIVSGNPNFYSGALVISKILQDNKVDYKTVPNISSKDYLLSKLSINEQLVDSFSLHGRDFIDLSKLLMNRYTFVLADEFTVRLLNDVFRYLSSDDIDIILASRLGSDDEIIKQIYLDDYLNIDMSELMPYSLLIKRNFELSYKISSCSEFLQDDGMITKETKRWLTLGALELKANQIFWDIGAGSGSVGIDAFKLFRVKSYLFEKNSKRFSDIELNLTRHKVISAIPIYGNFLDSIDSIERPDRVFIGGGGEKVLNRFMDIYSVLNDGGICVINLISLSNLSEIVELLKRESIDFESTSISIDNYNRSLLISESQRLMFQIKIKK
jgi:precorrin-6Y C5,15-methyltransferase (decarboxylating)